ncbi:hypothetical protein ABH309_05290 [Chromobacterium piscinae]|uniref:Uncharacterized protein n=1 Tax=Chromobacterium piscinae TaxID=686831 RepID=A0ABV0H4C1_9NEIS
MKEIEQSKFIKLQQTSLYLNDIIDIEKILLRSCKSIQLRTLSHEFENTSELKDSPDDLVHDLRITGQDPYIEITFSHYKTEIYINTNNHQSIGLLEEIINKVKKRKRWLAIILQNPIVIGIPFAAGEFGLSLASAKEKPVMPHLITISGLAIAISVLGFLLSLHHVTKKYNTIYLKTTKNQSNILSRKKDEILINLIPAVIAAIIGVIATALFLR